ncbi:uncharacterized protein LOC108676959 [Hyalella azteca]|uniref:Uncharacterized protein LOC108676959 n=1 Tax=Hyalella azteca TaxID=294128 RepID=A0A8B7P3I3_HYAAZ|nr:uncharacterized protein LOC108676959 [Hyalella azteca]
MKGSLKLVVALAVLVVVLGMLGVCEGRYLPTRGDEARLEEIRMMLRDLLEGAAGGAPRLVKRDVETDNFQARNSLT